MFIISVTIGWIWSKHCFREYLVTQIFLIQCNSESYVYFHSKMSFSIGTEVFLSEIFEDHTLVQVNISESRRINTRNLLSLQENFITEEWSLHHTIQQKVSENSFRILLNIMISRKCSYHWRPVQYFSQRIFYREFFWNSSIWKKVGNPIRHKIFYRKVLYVFRMKQRNTFIHIIIIIY